MPISYVKTLCIVELIEDGIDGKAAKTPRNNEKDDEEIDDKVKYSMSLMNQVLVDTSFEINSFGKKIFYDDSVIMNYHKFYKIFYNLYKF